MAYQALRHYSQRDLRFRFVSNVDAHRFRGSDARSRSEETLFIISSKTFTTLETLTNAHAARAWSLRKLGDERAVSQPLRRRVDQRRGGGEIRHRHRDNMFGFWDWVGGRYSMDSAIGLSTMIAIGPEHFRAMLAGFHAMDEHFRTAPFERNLPVLMGCSAIWYNNFFDAQTVAVLPYDQYLEALAGLSAATDDGEQRQARHARRRRASTIRRRRSTGASRGTNGQHSFYQLIHQGTQAGALRLHRLLPDAESARRPARSADGEPVRADRGAGVRQDGR